MEQVIQTYNHIFFDIVKKYDLNETNLFRKFIHSYDVAKNAFSIACNRRLNERERNLCYLIGLFHDVGRFEQWLQYKTYDDNKSVDHGELSYKIMNNLNCEELFALSKKEVLIFQESIRFHTKPYKGKNKDIQKFCFVLKTADAYANVVTIANGMQQMTVQANGVTGEILEGFKNRQLLLKYSPKTKLDRCLMLTASCYYIEDLYIRKAIADANYLDIIFCTLSKHLNIEEQQIFKQEIESLKDGYLEQIIVKI